MMHILTGLFACLLGIAGIMFGGYMVGTIRRDLETDTDHPNISSCAIDKDELYSLYNDLTMIELKVNVDWK